MPPPPDIQTPAPLLDVQNLSIRFRSGDQEAEVVHGISFTLHAGKILAVVGESGSGKSVSALALARLLPLPPACEVKGSIRFSGQEILTLPEARLRQLRGREIAYIFQEPGAALNPAYTIGFQIAEAVRCHSHTGKDVRTRVVQLLDEVGIRDAASRYDAYPHELSGGMQQRAMIAMALACSPRLLVADEPTTALDATIQKQILTLLGELRRKHNMAILLITHNFGVVAHLADEVAVMYRGEIVEHGATADVINAPAHAYTRKLLNCIPRPGQKRHRLIFALFLFFLAFTASAFATPPYIEYLYPAGARHGDTLEISLGGKSLDGASEVWISGEGVSGKVLSILEPTPAQINEAKKRDEAASQTVRLHLTVAPTATPGVRDLRIMAAGGLSNRFRFEVSAIPEVKETGASSAATPQVLPALPVVVNGQILNAGRDRFRFHAIAGCKLLIQVKGRAIKPFLADAVPGWFQPKITLFDAISQAPIASADDFRFDPDPVLLWTVPATGDYDVEIQDAVSRGRDDFVYRMTIGELPFVTDIFPLGARAGDKTVEITARGINLPGNEVRTRIPLAGSEPGLTTLALPTPSGPANARIFELGQLLEVSEREPNNLLKMPQTITPPVVINGRIDTPGDVDYYSFSAKKGDTLVIDVMARRLDSPLDAHLALTPSKRFATIGPDGKRRPPKLYVDDVKDERYGLITHHADPQTTVTIADNGPVQVCIRDIQGKGGPEYAYRLRIAHAQPDFEPRLTPDNISVPAGSSVVMQLKVFRLDDFNEPVRLAVEDLPAGFVLSAATIPAGKNNTLLTLTTPRDAKPGVYKPRFFAEAKVGTKTVRHPVNAAEELMQAFFYTHTVPVAQSYLVVAPPPPFFVEVLRPPGAGILELPFDTEVSIPVRIVRREEPKTPPKETPAPQAGKKAGKPPPRPPPVRVSATRAGGGISVTPAQIASDASEGVVKLRVTDPKRAGVEGILVLEGTQRFQGRAITAAAPAIPFKIG
ncbi:MAG: ABC transporter ATP-binding protein, partial [Puniceicoccales bacterium]|nr:ABC transporter ATP-binding protein [Puniceicoccales bacterium]